jgi:phage baseplate assembly protein gpV
LYRTEYDDGTVIEYDRIQHIMRVYTEHYIEVTAQNVKVTAPNVEIAGNVRITGNVQIAGNLSASGSVIDGGGNTNHHSH